ncbi:gephyrin-like molybdotransferase Glp [Asticcacaulis tiandongensis]|uniref:molybdopterin molybdotransferase MoeA n=1 Tax=Asticcacaulis tiandongensis TaxID=2565365 RepID=UPI0011263E02|nr:gephyrin-like molybdotransferase Glp [Asticcacaulis tiandongensis]
MISYNEAIDLIAANAVRAAARTVSLSDALGQILAEDVVASLNLPPFRNSAMDGFAIKRTEVAAGQASEIGATVAAGDVTPTDQAPVVRIMTGALVSSAYDAVIPIEQAEVSGQSVVFAHIPAAGANIREAGEDVAQGEAVLNAGESVTPEKLALLAALGVREVSVITLPDVHVFSTGNELSDGGNLSEAMIHNSNGPYLLAAARRAGLVAHDGGIIRDEAQNLVAAIQAIKTPSIIITTGAVSKGEKDFVPEALKALGAEIVFHRINLRPGKPILFARLPQGHFYFGLPGNPVAAAVGWRFFVQALVRQLSGLGRERPLVAKLKAPVVKGNGLYQFLKAGFELTPDGLRAEVLDGQESFKLKSLAQGHGYIALPEAAKTYEAGEAVEAFLYDATSLFEVGE